LSGGHRKALRPSAAATRPDISSGSIGGIGSDATVERLTNESVHTPETLPEPYFPADAPDWVIVEPGAQERYVAFVRTQCSQQFQKIRENAEAHIAQCSGEIRQLQRRLNAARSSYRRLEANESERQLAADMEQEFERLLSLTGVVGFALENGSLVLKAAIRYEYQNVWYDFGDWSVNLSWNSFSDTNKWLTREDRRGFRNAWLEEGRSYRYPVYRIGSNTFCFGNMKESVENHLSSGRILEGTELALACMHFVNPDDRDKIPLAFYPAADSLGAATKKRGAAQERAATREGETAQESATPRAEKVAFIPDRETIVRAYSTLRADTAVGFAMLLELGSEIAFCQSRLSELKEQKVQDEKELACALREAQALEARPLSVDGEHFDWQVDYLRNLVGVTRIDFRGGGMILDVSVRFSKGEALYDLGDWRVYLGGQEVKERDFAHFCIENARSGVRPFWNRSLPPGNRENLIGAVEHGNDICACVEDGLYPEAAALAIFELYRFDAECLAAIPRAFMQVEPAVAARGAAGAAGAAAPSALAPAAPAAPTPPRPTLRSAPTVATAAEATIG
jgi:FtsZ-binding cell division protein ZapB